MYLTLSSNIRQKSYWIQYLHPTKNTHRWTGPDNTTTQQQLPNKNHQQKKTKNKKPKPETQENKPLNPHQCRRTSNINNWRLCNTNTHNLRTGNGNNLRKGKTEHIPTTENHNPPPRRQMNCDINKSTQPPPPTSERRLQQPQNSCRHWQNRHHLIEIKQQNPETPAPTKSFKQTGNERRRQKEAKTETGAVEEKRVKRSRQWDTMVRRRKLTAPPFYRLRNWLWKFGLMEVRVESRWLLLS